MYVAPKTYVSELRIKLTHKRLYGPRLHNFVLLRHLYIVCRILCELLHGKCLLK